MTHKTFVIFFGILFLLSVAGLAFAHPDGEPLATFSTTFFDGSGSCGRCHTALSDDAGDDVSFDNNWRASIMANSAKDPLWQAKVASEIARTPLLQAALEKKCSTCHMPMAHTQATAEGTTVAMFGEGFLDVNHALHEAAMDGTSCALCHQISDHYLGDPASFNGYFAVDTTATRDRPIYGSYNDANVHNMSGSYTAVYGLHIDDSANCATCHTLYTTPFDADGVPVPGQDSFPEQVPYLEWENSAFGAGLDSDQTCQACHMPDISGSARLVKQKNKPLRSAFGKHTFSSGNSLMLTILRDNGAEIGVTATSDHFTEQLNLAAEGLGVDTATLTIQDAQIAGSVLTVDLLVENKVGHKLPTGIPVRRVWIYLQVAADGEQEVLFESGAPLANGRIAGNDADLNLLAFEPHYDLIDSAQQVQIYEGIMADWQGDVTYTLLRAAQFAKDNRLLPLGFDKGAVPTDVAVFGAALADADFSGGQDAIRYQIPLPQGVGPVTVTAELLYQPVSYAFVQDLAQEAGSEYADRFLGYYDAAEKMPVVVAGDSAVVEPGNRGE